jgi:ribosomal protein L37AE/L43A
VSYVIVQPVYGPPIAHQASCWTLKKRTSNDVVESVPAGAVICSHCHRVPSEAREPEWDEDGFIIVRDPRFPKQPSIAHHPLCRTLSSRYMGGARWNHRHVTVLPKNTRLCKNCNGKPPKLRVQRPNGEMRPALPRGEYVLRRQPNKKPTLVPVRCPQCSGEALDRYGARSWFCYSCDWIGGVVRKTWTLVERQEAPRSTERGEGRTVAHGSIQDRVLRGISVH